MSTTVVQPKRSRLVLIGFVAVFMILGGVLGASVARQLAATDVRPSSQSTDAVDSRVTFVHALGRLEPAGTVLKISPRSGNDGARVEKLRVHEGDDVDAGSIVAVLDNEPARRATLAEAEARRNLAQVRLDQVKAGAKAGDIAAQSLLVDINAEQLRVAERDLTRAHELVSKKALTMEQLEGKQWAVDKARLEHRRAEELLKSIREVREIDVRVAERDLASAEAAVHRAEIDLEATFVRAPSAGRVLKVLTHEGEKIGDQGLLEFGDVLHMQAVAEVFEADIVQLSVGLKATIKVDCLNEPISGEVIEIGHRVARKVVLTNDPVSDTDARVVEVRLKIEADQIERVTRLANARIEVTIDRKSDPRSPAFETK